MSSYASYSKVVERYIGKEPDGTSVVPHGEAQREQMKTNVLLVRLIERIDKLTDSMVTVTNSLVNLTKEVNANHKKEGNKV